MLDATQTITNEFDPFASASDPVVPTYDLFGKWEINAWACALVKGQGKVPFDPANPNHRRFTAIDMFVQPLLEIDVKYPKTLEDHQLAESKEWAQITLPSIKDAAKTLTSQDMGSVRQTNAFWVRVSRVPNGKKYEKKDAQGNPTGEMRDETIFKVVAFFADENACRAAYVAAGGQSNGNGHNVSVEIGTEDAEKLTAYQFLKVIVQNAAKGKDLGEAQAVTEQAITQYPTVAKFFTVTSPETQALIVQFCNPAI